MAPASAASTALNQRRRPQPAEGGMDTPRLIARDDLVARLDRAASRKVTIISAPAGSGKTSLLRAWAVRGSRAGSPCCAGKLMELRNAER